MRISGEIWKLVFIDPPPFNLTEFTAKINGQRFQSLDVQRWEKRILKDLQLYVHQKVVLQSIDSGRDEYLCNQEVRSFLHYYCSCHNKMYCAPSKHCEFCNKIVTFVFFYWMNLILRSRYLSKNIPTSYTFWLLYILLNPVCQVQDLVSSLSLDISLKSTNSDNC